MTSFTFTIVSDTDIILTYANVTPYTEDRIDLDLEERGPCVADNTVLATSTLTILQTQLPLYLTF